MNLIYFVIVKQNDVQNMTLDKELIETRLKEGDKKYHFDVQSLASQMNDKNLVTKINKYVELFYGCLSIN